MVFEYPAVRQFWVANAGHRPASKAASVTFDSLAACHFFQVWVVGIPLAL